MVIAHRLSVQNVTYGYDEESQKWYELAGSVSPMPTKISRQYYFPLVTQQELTRLWVEQVHEGETMFVVG